MKKIYLSTLIVFLFLCNSYAQSTATDVSHEENEIFGLANQKCIAHDYAGALSLYDEAVKMDPKNYLIYYNRAIAKLNLADNAGACEDLKKSMELGYGKAKETMDQFCK